MSLQRKLVYLFGATALVPLLLASAQAIEVAGTLFVDLSAVDGSAGGPSWINTGSLGDFIEVGDPRAVNVSGGVPAVYFDGIDDAYQSPVGAPSGLTGLDPTRSIEAWVFNPSIPDEETIVSWGHRGGPDGSNMSFNYGQHGAFGAVGHWGGADIGWVDNDPGTAGAPAPMQWHHLVYTYDGTTTRVYSDGSLQNSEVLGPGVINTHPDTKITVASQLEADGVALTGGLKGNLAIARLRIHDGVLSDTQILSNYTEEVGAFPNPPLPPAPTPKPLLTGPQHRYSFSNAPAADAAGGVLEDSISGANGVVLGAGGSFTGGQLKLPGGPSTTQAYADLPNGLLSSLTDATLEAWVTVDGSQNWGRIFDFGSTTGGEVTGPGGGGEGLDYLALTSSRGTEINQQRLELRNEDPAGGGITTLDANTSTTPGQGVHVAVVYDSDGGLFGDPVLRYYRDGVLEGETTTAIKLEDLNDVNNWLGRSNWTADANMEGTFDEFRIYDRALSTDEVLGNLGAGPDVVNVVPEPTALAMLAAASLGLAASRQLRRRRRTR